ncbi:sulfite exporter TauE/SafE family protein [Salinicola sp. MH3R3-1]|uniref:sulfite exporter TauE/SafE family protein n=1 Tax=Salinicola sp. MH3R3-1 TaxID=1928762 RepID=UPI000B0B2F2C|nr:sulfite exporter TauE/SafE family protein [Salinicola sp. MH3R3-1]
MMSSVPQLWPAIGLACFAGLVRGYCGFGFAMLLALGLTLFLPPIEAVPLALLLDLVTSAGLWRRAVRLADWRRLQRLLCGMVVATGVGVSLIATLPAAPMRIAVALLALAGASALLLRREPRPDMGEIESGPTGREAKGGGWPSVMAGGVSGLCMTLASSGGPPLMLYLLHQRLPPVGLRATAILFFAASSSASLVGLGLAGELSRETLARAAWLLIPALIGNLLGQWVFERSKPRSMKVTVAPLLIALSVWVLVREALAR